MKDHFREWVVDNFIESYKQGVTPNPCVRCNRYLKFGEAWKRINELGIEYFATGHYAHLDKDEDGIVHLKKAKDDKKDQTYFMYQLTQEQLQKVLFPLAGYTKPEVRALAEKFGLLTAKKSESQGLCFMPREGVGAFIKQHVELKEGEIKDLKTREVIGTHQGLQKYTIGQRQGIGLAGGPWFVYSMDKNKNVLWVTTDEAKLGTYELRLTEVNWLSGKELKFPLITGCKIRYRSKESPAVVTKDKDGYLVTFEEPQRAITPGQSAVFYTADECLGGGVIIANKV